MTVEKLIEELQKMPKDAKVYLCWQNFNNKWENFDNFYTEGTVDSIALDIRGNVELRAEWQE